MKKTAYIAPATIVTEVEMHPLMDGSVTSVGGNSGLQIGTEETPSSADSRRGFSIWDEE